MIKNTCGALLRSILLDTVWNSNLIPSNIYDFSNENWTVVDADTKIIELAAEFALTPFTQQHIVFPVGVQISYLVQTELSTILAEGTENSIEYTHPVLEDTDEIIEWYADWVEANDIEQTQINMDAYDACTAASETDRGRFATEENENSFINLEIE
jgi:hypothetical protein